jgi:hypothetical protein
MLGKVVTATAAALAAAAPIKNPRREGADFSSVWVVLGVFFIGHSSQYPYVYRFDQHFKPLTPLLTR